MMVAFMESFIKLFINMNDKVPQLCFFVHRINIIKNKTIPCPLHAQRPSIKLFPIQTVKCIFSLVFVLKPNTNVVLVRNNIVFVLRPNANVVLYSSNVALKSISNSFLKLL